MIKVLVLIGIGVAIKLSSLRDSWLANALITLTGS